MRLFIVILFCILLALTGGCIQHTDTPAPSENPGDIPEQTQAVTFAATAEPQQINNGLEIETLLGGMTTEQKIGQLIMMSYSQETADENAAGPVCDIQPGGIVLREENFINPQQTRQLVDSLNSYSQTPL
ncbi:MAG: hypothetical protein PHO15_02150, partial [Eubacteriales bacterium]|nr:hypothetical protein [Eubacteriales bacterium]